MKPGIKSFCILFLALGVTVFPNHIGSSRNGADGVDLELFPKHFLLHPGEQIHYTVLQRSPDNQLRFVNATFSVRDPNLLRLIKPSGVFEAVTAGRTEVMVTSATLERRVSIEIAGRAQPPM